MVTDTPEFVTVFTLRSHLLLHPILLNKIEGGINLNYKTLSSDEIKQLSSKYIQDNWVISCC